MRLKIISIGSLASLCSFYVREVAFLTPRRHLQNRNLGTRSYKGSSFSPCSSLATGLHANAGLLPPGLTKPASIRPILSSLAAIVIIVIIKVIKLVLVVIVMIIWFSISGSGLRDSWLPGVYGLGL